MSTSANVREILALVLAPPERVVSGTLTPQDMAEVVAAFAARLEELRRS